MYHKKKIALFISHIYGEYQSNLCQGIIKSANDFGYQVEVYTSNDGENLGAYSIGEDSILDIPNFNEIDGVIFASETYTDPSFRQKITSFLLAQSDCKVIEICEDNPSFINITMDNNSVVGLLTEHMITVHHASNICYLGSEDGILFSNRRQEAFENAMKKHKLNITDSNIYIANNTRDSLLDALNSFTNNQTQTPDAIICYNDDMAIKLWMIAEELGYNIPDDFAITGCDNSEAGANTFPPLTTITFPTYELGACAFTALHSLIAEKKDFATTVVAQPVYGGSCGCKNIQSNSSFLYSTKLQNKIENLETSMFISMKMSTEFSHINDIDNGMDILEKYILNIEECSEFYLCLYSNWNSPSKLIKDLTGYEDDIDNDNIELKLAIKNGKRLPDCTFTRNSLLPDFIYNKETAAYIVTPLFFEEKAFGYLVLASNQTHFDENFRFLQWVVNITQLLQDLCEAKNSAVMTEHLEGIYLIDVLTGLYNNHGFLSKQEEILLNAKDNSIITSMIFDLDELKTINDRFGHNEGDFALKTIGQALSSTKDETTICARFTGDEFYCLAAFENEENAKDFLLRVDNYLNNFNRLSDKPYNISVSSGYAYQDISKVSLPEDFNLLFEKADKNMYQVKKTKIKNIIK